MHQLNPLTKLAAVLWLVSASTVLPPAGTVTLVLAGAGVAVAAGVGARVIGRLVVTLLPLAIALGIVHGFIIGRPDALRVGSLVVSPAGLAFAGTIVARLAAILTGSLLLVATTHPSDLLKSLDAAGAPPAVSYLLASPLLLLEPLAGRAADIRAAQRARGLDLTGSWAARIRALPILLIPLITLALTDLDHRVLVLNGRAFGACRHRTVIDPPIDTPGQRWFRRIAIGLALLELGLLIHWR